MMCGYVESVSLTRYLGISDLEAERPKKRLAELGNLIPSTMKYNCIIPLLGQICKTKVPVACSHAARGERHPISYPLCH